MTSVCRNPNFLNISTTVSIGVWSVTVIGAMSKIFLRLSGGGPKFCTGAIDVNKTIDCPVIPSMKRFAFAECKKTGISH